MFVLEQGAHGGGLSPQRHAQQGYNQERSPIEQPVCRHAGRILPKKLLWQRVCFGLSLESVGGGARFRPELHVSLEELARRE